MRYLGNDRIQIVEAAVGASSGSVEITVAGPFTSTNQHIIASYQTIDWAKRAVQKTSRLTVPQRALDDILESAGLAGTAHDVVIVDVEGAEDAVFSGFSLARLGAENDHCRTLSHAP